MYYTPRGKYMWDFWLHFENGVYHMYYLQATRDLSNPETRKNVAHVGHATSKDLIDWEEHGTVLEPGPTGSWDDLSIWTGSVIKGHDKRYYMLYTGRSKQKKQGKMRATGVAISDDLYNWRKYDKNPVMTADPQWYEQYENSPIDRQYWRDPYVIYHPEDDCYYAFVTTRVNFGQPKFGRGCIGVARSVDLLNWEVLPPLALSLGRFKCMEVPNIFKRNGRWYLLFTVDKEMYTEEYKQEIAPQKPQRGILYYTADELFGNYEAITGQGVLLGDEEKCYTSQVIKNGQGEDILLTWREEADGYDGFAGCLDYPRKIKYTENGKLFLESFKKES